MRITGLDDDSTGKHKLGGVKARSAVLSATLLVGVCLGVMVSEKIYLLSQEAEVSSEALAAVRSRKLELNGGGGSAQPAALAASGARRASGKPRNKLEEVLRRVAPQGEVMIAISNMNLVHEQSLTQWLEVRRGAGGGRGGAAVGVQPCGGWRGACGSLPCWPRMHAPPRCRAADCPPPCHLPRRAVRAAHPGPDQLAGGGDRRGAARLLPAARRAALLPPRGHPRLPEGHGVQPRHLRHEVGGALRGGAGLRWAGPGRGLGLRVVGLGRARQQRGTAAQLACWPLLA